MQRNTIKSCKRNQLPYKCRNISNSQSQGIMKQYQVLKEINANLDCYTQLEVHEHQPRKD